MSGCPHLSPELIRKASELVKKHMQDGGKSGSMGDNMECVQCSMTGQMLSFNFQKHFLDHRHHLAVRTEHPYELFCVYCGDYQYHSSFDELTGRKRMRTFSAPASKFCPVAVRKSSPGSRPGDDNNKVEAEGNSSAMTNMKRLEEIRAKGLPLNAPRGITNMGATCFMSSVLQVMLMSQDVRSCLQEIVPFDERGSIEVDVCRCRKREVEEKLKHEAKNLTSNGSSTPVTPAKMKEEEGAVAPMDASSAGSWSGGDGNGVLESRAGSCGGLINGGGTPGTPQRGPSASFGGTSSNSKQSNGSGSVVGDGGDTKMDVQGPGSGSGLGEEDGGMGDKEKEMEEAVTSGCIPCELRSIFVETLEGGAEMSAGAGVGTTITTSSTSAQGGSPMKLENAAGAGLGSGGQAGGGGGAGASSPPAQLQPGILTTKKYTRQYPPIVPSKLLFSVWTFADHMAGYEQQDAHEFMIAFLDGIETHLREYHSPPPPRAINASSSSSSSGEIVNHKIVSNLFSGVLESEVRCAHCGCISSTAEPFLDLSLSLDHAVRLSGKEQIQGISLQTCMDEYATAESLATPIHCDKCKEHRESVKKLSIRKPPKILAIHLKRFDAVSQRKLHTKVHFPTEDFDICPYMQSLSSARQTHAGEIYDLVGVVVHKGSLNSGHYISYVLQSQPPLPHLGVAATKNWLRCDDETITAVGEMEVRAAEAYILFYLRRKD